LSRAFEWLKGCFWSNGLAMKLPSILGTFLLLLGCTAEVEPNRTGEARLPALVAQRVTATVRREALRLVRLETEHEVFLTTPEHPFATPRSGWIRAGQLVPGDWVKSERFGAVRLSSVRSERAARPVPVFNLSVASSHAYFVGTDRVLVHNVKCKPNDSESKQEALARNLREREKINRELQALQNTKPPSRESPERIAILKKQRDQLKLEIKNLRAALVRKTGVKPESREDAERRRYEADNETAKKELEEAQKELDELERRSSPTEEAELERRKSMLKQKIASRKLDAERTKQILTWAKQLADLKKRPDAERGPLAEKIKELTAKLAEERKRARDAKHARKKRATPEGHGDGDGTGDLPDAKRPRDRLKLLEEELADVRDDDIADMLDIPPERREARIEYLTQKIETTKNLSRARSQYARTVRIARSRRLEREQRMAEGGDTSNLDQEIARLDQELVALRIEMAQARTDDLLLDLLEGGSWLERLSAADEAPLHEIERDLAQGVDAEQLAEIERRLDEMEPTDAALQESVLHEARDVEATVQEYEALLHGSASPQRDAAFESSYQRLQKELRDERQAVEAAQAALTNEYANVQTTQASSSSGATWQQRLGEIGEELRQLHAQWRARMQGRLDAARGRLDAMRRAGGPRDEAAEAALAREIALLDYELQD
jgi:hypothetical protein